jgi:hypothetical protein
LRCLHTSQAKVIFGRTSVLDATSAALFLGVLLVAMAGLEPAT